MSPTPEPPMERHDLPSPELGNWQTIEAYLDFLMGLPQTEAEQFIANLAQDHGLFAEKLRGLLHVDAQVQWLLDEPLFEQLQSGTEPEMPLPDSIGNYRIIKVLGKGGMGTVFLAEPLGQGSTAQVAIKVLREDNRSQLRTHLFLREAKILGKLHHQGIAKLIDSGVTPEGQPFLVMEYINGTSLQQYFEKQQSTPKQILAIFLKICEAVAYAHQHLIIHRDLKPENILITPEGVPKLLDFGVGKMLEQVDESLEVCTTTRLLTPKYASPEQVFGETVSSKTDIFSLGVLFYELLTGDVPFHIPANPSLRELTTLFDKAPEKPSLLWKRISPYGRNQTNTSDWFPKDLDFVILRAIRVESEKRYESVHHFSQDLKKVLEGQSLYGTTENFSYLMGRLVHKHPLVVCGFLISIFSLGFLSVNLFREKRLAEQQKTKAQNVSLFLESIFDVGKVFGEDGTQVSAKVLLDHAVLELENHSEKGKVISDDLWVRTGELYFKLGLYDQAQKSVQRALELAKESGETVQEAQRLIDLATIQLAKGRKQTAEANFSQARTVVEDLDNLEEDYPARYFLGMARIKATNGQLKLSDAFFSKAMAWLDNEQDFDDMRMLVLTSYGELKKRQGDMAQAERFLKEALLLAKNLHGPIHNRVAVAYNNLGTYYSKLEQVDQAEHYFKNSIAISEKLYGYKSPQVFYALNNLAIIFKKSDQLNKAEAMYLRCEEVGLQHFGPNSNEMATLWSNLAVMKNAQKKFEAADAYYQKILACDLGETSTALFRKNYGDNLYDMGRFEEAEKELRFSLQHQRSVHGDNNMLVASLNIGVGKCLMKKGDFAKAKTHFKQALDTIAALYPADHLYVASTHLRMGQVSAQLGETTQAVEYFERALAIRKQKWGSTSTKLGGTLRSYLAAAKQMGLLEKEQELTNYLTQLDLAEKKNP